MTTVTMHYRLVDDVHVATSTSSAPGIAGHQRAVIKPAAIRDVSEVGRHVARLKISG